MALPAERVWEAGLLTCWSLYRGQKLGGMLAEPTYTVSAMWLHPLQRGAGSYMDLRSLLLSVVQLG